MIKLLRLVGSDLSETSAVFRRKWLVIAFGFFCAWLFIATLPLWLNSTGHFPSVPLLAPLSTVPTWLDQLIFVIMFICCLSFADIRSRYYPFRIFLGCAVLLILINQHRLQPWLVQAVLLAAFGASLPRKDFVSFARLLLISIYLFSAVSKFDHQFLNTLGQQFVETALGFFGVDASKWSQPIRVRLAVGFPLAELLVGLGLLIPGSRRFAVWAAIALHACLLLILGPWGLQHHLGVLCWNLFFVAQIWILYLMPVKSAHASDGHLRLDSLTWAHRVGLGLLCLPLLEFVGLYDHWPAWQLYAPRNSRVAMNVLTTATNKLPKSFAGFVRPVPNSPWVRLDLDRMSLEQAWVPIYPQDRFQLGVALAIADRYDLRGALQVKVQSTSNRWNGVRTEQVLRSRDEIAVAARRFRFNATPTAPASRSPREKTGSEFD